MQDEVADGGCGNEACEGQEVGEIIDVFVDDVLGRLGGWR